MLTMPSLLDVHPYYLYMYVCIYGRMCVCMDIHKGRYLDYVLT
jgi:hypothetical protein